MSNSQPPDSTERRTSQTSFDVLRWFLMVPAALLASWLGRSLGGLFLFLRSPVYPEFLFPLLTLLPRGVAFTVAGAFVAPRYRIAVSIGLAVLCVTQSVGIHILLPSNRGLVNYMHSLGESLGSALGVILITSQIRKSRNITLQEHTQ